MITASATYMLSLVFSMAALGSSATMPTCAPELAEGTTCTTTVESLHPTQLSYGKIEVEQRTAKLEAKSDKKLDKYLLKNAVPVVIGPDGGIYITDGHHMALALAAAKGQDAQLYATIQHDWHTLDTATFWSQMSAAQLVYLYDQNGQGPLPLSALPTSLFDLGDDPYRSLAWGVRKDGGYNDTTLPFADFTWANFFRSRVTVDQVENSWSDAVAAGVTAAESTAASALPGFHGPKS